MSIKFSTLAADASFKKTCVMRYKNKYYSLFSFVLSTIKAFQDPLDHNKPRTGLRSPFKR